jgi:Fic family protein
MRVSTHGDWVGWLLYFLEGVGSEAEAAVNDAERLLTLQASYHERLGRTRTAARGLIDQLFINPYITATRAATILNVTPPTARAAISELLRAAVLIEISGRKWGRRFLAPEILDAVEGSTASRA